MTRNRFSALTTAASIATELNMKGYQITLDAASTIDVSVFNDGSEEQKAETWNILSKYCTDGDEIETKESNGINWHTFHISFVK